MKKIHFPRSLIFNTDAEFRSWPRMKILSGETSRGWGYIVELGWLKVKLDVFSLNSWNAFCDRFNNN